MTFDFDAIEPFSLVEMSAYKSSAIAVMSRNRKRAQPETNQQMMESVPRGIVLSLDYIFFSFSRLVSVRWVLKLICGVAVLVLSFVLLKQT
jgi:hypothetical protein